MAGEPVTADSRQQTISASMFRSSVLQRRDFWSQHDGVISHHFCEQSWSTESPVGQRGELVDFKRTTMVKKKKIKKMPDHDIFSPWTALN